MRRLSYAYLFWIVAVLRFLCVPPFVIDDDEAWWSAASVAMKSPWDFYRSAVDHKPPGVVWFYWIVDHLIPCASDPRVIRAAYTLMTIAAAAALGFTAFRLRPRAKSIGWLTGTLFLIVTAIPTPKLLAVTADGLIINFTIFAYALALFVEFPGVSIVAGAILGLALLIKQTAVFFCLPILFATWPRKWSWKEISGFALGAALVVIPSIVAVGAEDFLYWTWTYPKQVLTTVREQLFHSTLEMFESLAIFVVATLPILILMISRAVRSSGATLLAGLRDFRVLWLVSGLFAAFLGKGLFLHYLLLFAPPFALLAADALCWDDVPRFKTLGWLMAQYVMGVLILSLPASGIFWGTDLVYFGQLSRVMKTALSPDDRVMVWGGSALPLTFTGAQHVTRFVLPRFAVAPYATEYTRGIFHEELTQDPPALILDLHERGDNQFNNPIESEPFVSSLIHKDYRVYVSQSVPWAKFYFRHAPPSTSGLIEISGEDQIRAAYAPFPEKPNSWMTLVDLGKQQGASKIADVDWALRVSAALELLRKQGRSPEVRSGAQALAQDLKPDALTPELKLRILKFIEEKAAGLEPLPMISRAWWPSLALVELQPKAFH